MASYIQRRKFLATLLGGAAAGGLGTLFGACPTPSSPQGKITHGRTPRRRVYGGFNGRLALPTPAGGVNPRPAALRAGMEA